METKSMNKNYKYIKAKIKTQKQMEKVYPDVKYWGNPPKDRVWIPSPDELALPYRQAQFHSGLNSRKVRYILNYGNRKKSGNNLSNQGCGLAVENIDIF
jgi:hypothetical protein